MADTPCRRRQPGPGSSVRLSARPTPPAPGDTRGDTASHLAQQEAGQEMEVEGLVVCEGGDCESHNTTSFLTVSRVVCQEISARCPSLSPPPGFPRAGQYRPALTPSQYTQSVIIR